MSPRRASFLPDTIALFAVIGLGVAVAVYRAEYVEPRAWGAACAMAAPPVACGVRGSVLWLQSWGLFGAAALALGVWALRGAPWLVAPAAVIVGIAGVENFNATFGVLGAALGAWAWLVRLRPPPAPADRPA